MNIRHFICEDIRQEIDGKVTVVGLYPDDNLLTNEDILRSKPEDGIVAIDRLMLLININDYAGEVKIIVEILSPTNKPHGSRTEIGTINVPENRSYNVIINLSGFPVIDFGVYKINVLANDQIHEIPFKIIKS